LRINRLEILLTSSAAFGIAADWPDAHGEPFTHLLVPATDGGYISRLGEAFENGPWSEKYRNPRTMEKS
jgi:hypothetical protein